VVPIGKRRICTAKPYGGARSSGAGTGAAGVNGGAQERLARYYAALVEHDIAIEVEQ
jgi:hypothetical protein